MRYEKGLQALQQLLPESEQSTYNDLRKALENNLYRERLFGSTEAMRAQRAEIIHTLNKLAIQHTQTSFNALCNN